jgi:hypothetical protein
VRIGFEIDQLFGGILLQHCTHSMQKKEAAILLAAF